jgi:hypothetical protein
VEGSRESLLILVVAASRSNPGIDTIFKRRALGALVARP